MSLVRGLVVYKVFNFSAPLYMARYWVWCRKNENRVPLEKRIPLPEWKVDTHNHNARNRRQRITVVEGDKRWRVAFDQGWGYCFECDRGSIWGRGDSKGKKLARKTHGTL